MEPSIRSIPNSITPGEDEMEKKAYAVRDILDNSLNLIDRPEHSWLQF
jgi:hypothetical protein